MGVAASDPMPFIFVTILAVIALAFATCGELSPIVNHGARESTLTADQAVAARTVESIEGPSAAYSGGESWPTYHGSENRSGYSAFDGPSSGQLAWSRFVSVAPIRSGPVVSGPLVYVASTSGIVSALNATDGGSPVWNTSVGPDPSQIDVSRQLLLVGNDVGALVALSPYDGHPIWTDSLDGNLVQCPTVGMGVVYVGTSNGWVASYSLATGVPIWNVSVGQPVAGALALESGTLYGVTLGTLFAMSAATGALLWSEPVGSSIQTAPAVSSGMVVVGDLSGNVTAYSAVTGTRLWRWVSPDTGSGRQIYATPTIGLGNVYAIDDTGSVSALDALNGSLLWRTTASFSPYPYISSPALGPNALYSFSTGNYSVEAFNASSGTPMWAVQTPGFAPLYTSPALANSQLFLADDTGTVFALGSTSAVSWRVDGFIANSSGGPIPGVIVGVTGIASTITTSNGSFGLLLPNGTYSLEALKDGLNPVTEPLTVAGPVTGLRILMSPLTLYSVRGMLVDQYSGSGVSGATISVTGSLGFNTSTTTLAGGAFQAEGPNGTLFLEVIPPAGFSIAFFNATVTGFAIDNLRILVIPTGLGLISNDPMRLVLLAPLSAIGAAVLAAGVSAHWRGQSITRMRRERLSPLFRYLLMRLAMIPGQLVLLVFVLFAFLSLGPAIYSGTQVSPAGLWGRFAGFLTPLLTGNWGNFAYGPGLFASILHFPASGNAVPPGIVVRPITTFLLAWLPASVELATLALGISLLIGYPLGLLAGWKSDSAFDPGVRTFSAIGLLLPTVLVGLLLLLGFYDLFFRVVGDTVYGTLPSLLWFGDHGGTPTWVTTLGSTLPTGFPVVDGTIHSDWPFVEVVLAKQLLQATIIALIFVPVYLRYARSRIRDVANALYITASRARGVPDRTLLWRHAARNVWPVYLLLFGLTLPLYVGTQAVVEVLFNATGVGTVILQQMGILLVYGIYGTSQIPVVGAFGSTILVVLVVFLALTVLLLSVLSDAVARLLDPRTRGRP